MDEPEGKPPHAGERLTREDVLRLIEEHGGPEGLDLRWAKLRQANLTRLDLHGAILQGANLQKARLWRTSLQETNVRRASLQGAHLTDANLQGANLHDANLQGANLWRANLQGANLQGARLVLADLQGARLAEANLQGANLRLANLQQGDFRWADLRGARLVYASLREANLEGANWGDYVLGEESEGAFDSAASVYRTLKQRHTELGMYDMAGEFHYREMEARRKLAWKGGQPWEGRERRRPYALALNALRFLYGYGERPERVIGWVGAVILGFALGHWAFGTVEHGFWDTLYYSAVSFTALGYGSWAPEPQGWAGKFLGVGESLLGVFMMALFLVTFTRKMTR